MAKKKATIEYIQKLIQSLIEYTQEIEEEDPYRLRNTSAFWKRYKLSFYRYNTYVEDKSIDSALRVELQDRLSRLTSCLDEYNLLYMLKCKQNKTPFTQEELVAFKRYHKVLDNYSWYLENKQRLAEKEAGRDYYVESFE